MACRENIRGKSHGVDQRQDQVLIYLLQQIRVTGDQDLELDRCQGHILICLFCNTI